MKTLLLAAIVAGLGAASAGAADLPARGWTKAAVVADPGSQWGGWYVGANAGGAWGRGDVSSAVVNGSTGAINATANQQAVSVIGSPRLKPDGFTGGGSVGYNQQIDRWLFGVEADASYFGVRQSRRDVAAFPVGVGSFTTTNSVTTEWLATLRPRVGYSFDRTLLYSTGGLALTELKYSTTFADSAGNNEAAALSKIKAGWTVGAGMEHAFTTNWSAKVEYLYTDFGKQSAAGPVATGVSPTPNIITHDVDLKTSTVRGGLNYHFGGPSVARY